MVDHTNDASSVEAFLARGGSVCPFAVRSHRIYASAGKEPRLDRTEFLSAAKAFARTHGATPNGALLVRRRRHESDGALDFDGTRTWARDVFLELMMCFGLTDGATETQLASILRDVRRILLDEHDPRRRMLGSGGHALFAICMSPLYPATHPRYAPETTVVVTWIDDVAAASQQPAVMHIRKSMAAGHGFVYDANELVLPIA
jgi:hypothetical protein